MYALDTLLLPRSSKFPLQPALDGFFKHLSFAVSAMSRFLSRGHERDTTSSACFHPSFIFGPRGRECPQGLANQSTASSWLHRLTQGSASGLSYSHRSESWHFCLELPCSFLLDWNLRRREAGLLQPYCHHEGRVLSCPMEHGSEAGKVEVVRWRETDTSRHWAAPEAGRTLGFCSHASL